ncbi:hypothetical protein F5144DRAFT_651701 [Chaetomium tenue]|uniref:Uncharacterized protein n=1 Tax=Chaetomium tenue TaxID=1854479 RepID=A0ACB7P0J2_9PEZI|nr:hypothetical protein F5144DRAFT_651701 [Chaetomium globosum]
MGLSDDEDGSGSQLSWDPSARRSRTRLFSRRRLNRNNEDRDKETTVLDPLIDFKEPEDRVGPQPVARFDQDLPTVSPPCRVALVNVSGLNGLEAGFDYDNLAHLTSVEALRKTIATALDIDKISFRFRDDRILGETATKDAIGSLAVELLDHVARSQPEDIVVIFVARDLGGSVLKQRTALLLFYERSTALDGPWLPQQLQHLSAFHEDLTVKFRTLLETGDFELLSIYQEPPGLATYELLVPEAAATLSQPREVRIGLHRSYQSLAEFRDLITQTAFANKVQDVRSKRQPEYQLFIKLLSNHGLSIPARHYNYSRPAFRNFCDWLLLDSAFAPWVDTEFSLELLPEDSVERAGTLIAKNVMVLEVGEAINDTAILAGSLVASMRSKRALAVDHFITLAHHHPQALTLTKPQLMASLCHQILTHSPRLLNHIGQWLKLAREALQSHNFHWKEAVLWQILKRLFSSKSLRHVCIIIHQPPEAKFSRPFLDLLTDVDSLLETTNIHCKILVVRAISSSKGPPQRWPVLQKVISHGDEGARAALEMDFTEEWRIHSHSGPDPTALRARAVSVLLRDGLELGKARLLANLIAKHTLLSLELLVNTSLGWETDDGLASLISDLIPKTFRAWVGTGLLWMTHAARPLTRIELEAALSLAFDSCRNSTAAPLPLCLVDIFADFLCGLVEVDATGVVFSTCPYICGRVLTHIRLGQDEPKLFLETQPNIGAPDGQAELALHCLRYLSQDGDSMEQPAAPLCRYAVEHWLSHLNLSEDTTVIASVMADFVLSDQDRAGRWIQQRALYWASHDAVAWRELEASNLAPPSLEELVSEFSYQSAHGSTGMMEIIDLAFEASALRTVRGRQMWHALALAAAQTGKLDALRVLDGRGHLDGDGILDAIYESGSRDALRGLVQIKPAWSLQYEFGPSFSSANYEPPLIHDLAANGQISGVEYHSGHVDLLAKLLVAISEPALRINHHDALGLTALHLGTARGHVVDPPDNAGGYVETVRALIGRGASIGFRDDEGKTPLHLALEDISCPEQRRSVDLDAAAKGSLTPLTLAVRNSLLPAVRSLLRLGAGVNTANTNQDNITPLHAAVKHGSYEVVEELLGAEGIEVNARDDQNITPLHLAAELDHASVQDWRGLTPLSVACLPGNASAVKMLLPSVPRDQLGLPYYWASRSGNEEVLGLVLDAGVDKNSKWSIDGAIHHALLLVRRVDLEVRDNNGATALMRAVEQDARASVSSEDGKGHTCFRILLRSCYSMEFKVPTGKSVSYETVIFRMLFSLSPSPDMVVRLVSQDCDASHWDPNEEVGRRGTMLHYAAYFGRLHLTEVLIQSDRVDVNKRNDEYDSPSCIEIVQKLLDKGALTSIGSSYFGSPLHAAAATPNYIWMDGRDPAAINLTAGYFGTPLAAALDRGTEAMITELLNHSPSLVIIASIVEAVGGLVPTLEMLLDRAAPGVTPATPDAVGHNEAFISLLTTPEVTLLSRAVGGRHALHFAAGSGSMSVAAELLVRHPEAIDDVDDDGWTPLHWACRQDSVPMTKRGWQPIDVAMVSPETPEKPPPPLLAGEQERSPPNAAALAMTGEYLSYHCDNCVLDIYGPRYCCTCHGLDLCFKCFRLTSQHLFTGHHFELFDMLGNRLSAAGEEDTDGH